MSGYSVPAATRGLPVAVGSAKPAYNQSPTSPGARKVNVAASLPSTLFGNKRPASPVLSANASTSFNNARVNGAIPGVSMANRIKVALPRGVPTGPVPGSITSKTVTKT